MAPKIAIDTRQPEFVVVDGVQVPICGDEDVRQRTLLTRLRGPQGQPLERWEQEWRAGHTPHYYSLAKAFQYPDANPDAKKCLLVGARLNRADLTGMNLDGVNLTNASFRGADLSEASLRGANLTKADLSRASLHRADLTEAILNGADMSMAYAKGALFQNAEMWRVHLRHGIFDSALFFDANMRLCNLMYASFWGARFDGAQMEGVQHIKTANFARWLEPDEGKQNWSMEPVEGWHGPVWVNPMGTTTFQVNAGRQ